MLLRLLLLCMLLHVMLPQLSAAALSRIAAEAKQLNTKKGADSFWVCTRKSEGMRARNPKVVCAAAHGRIVHQHYLTAAWRRGLQLTTPASVPGFFTWHVTS